jgi:hypothetical protein
MDTAIKSMIGALSAIALVILFPVWIIPWLLWKITVWGIGDLF